MSLACVLVSDVTGSTELFENRDGAEALAAVDSVLERMRELIEAAGGHCVKARGDDILSFFPSASSGFGAAWAMINEPWAGGLSIHAGLCFGEILSHENDIYGSAVNTAARLSVLAKPGEILMGETCHGDLAPEEQARFVDIGALPLRGIEAPTRVYSCSVQSFGEVTEVFGSTRAATKQAAVFAAFSAGARHWYLEEGEVLRLGRAAQCDIVVNAPSVSRSHGALTIRSGQLEFTDHSSAGSVVRLADGQELTVHRRTTLLSGRGSILLGRAGHGASENVIDFSIGGIGAR
ncbi:adenylate/guanylate cyclase domain-containing protein [Oceaniglobus roseus]|uniref:adenylate/guanylate cyclase domain-containing protein n=1 Tax=Oceaniglobus roseus TaxID=1737570 RepID=UPI000C7EEF44|nr:adenylate/guanylate cyclase domain-containing protein [Kandeliimicrobium roseum]